MKFCNILLSGSSNCSVLISFCSCMYFVLYHVNLVVYLFRNIDNFFASNFYFFDQIPTYFQFVAKFFALANAYATLFIHLQPQSVLL